MPRVIQHFRPWLFCLLALCVAGCAELKPPSESGTLFTSKPSGAEVFVEGGYFGRTPVSVKLKRDQVYAVRFHAEGYVDQTYRFTIRDRTVHGILPPIGITEPEDDAAGKDPASHARGSIIPVPPPSEGSRLLALPGVPVTVVLGDGSVLAAKAVEPAGIDYVKISETKYIANSKIRSIATSAPSDWTKRVLEERKRVGVK